MNVIRANSNDIFKSIENCKELGDLKKIRPTWLDPYFLNVTKYPDIPYTLSKKEIEDLGGLNLTLSKKIVEKNLTSLEKLLLAILWKNGDFGKEKHILEGILESTPLKDKENGLVFYQFGKRLCSPENEPIIDQHIIRAYRFHFNPSNLSIREIIEKEELTKKDFNDIKEYKKWTTQLAANIDGEKHLNLFEMDKILFAMGKYLKRSKKQLIVNN